MVSPDTLLAQMGIHQDVEGALEIGRRAAEEQRKREARERAIFEARETAWAAYHLNFPYNTRGFGPWANEQQSYSEKRQGSILGFGFIDNPLNQTEAERRSLIARDQNRVRLLVRDAFNAGESYEQLKNRLASDAASPDDLRRHYGLPLQTGLVVTPAQLVASLPFPLNLLFR